MLTGSVRVGLVLAALVVATTVPYIASSTSRVSDPGVSASMLGSRVVPVLVAARVRSVPSVPAVRGAPGGAWRTGACRRCASAKMLHSNDAPPATLGAPFAAVASDTLLPERGHDSEPRRRIQEEIRMNPGIHYRELQRRLGIANGDLSHHLRRLVHAGEIVSTRGHGRLHFFLSEFRGPMEAYALPDRCQQVLQLVRQNPGATEVGVMRAVNLSLGRTSEILRCLESEGWALSVHAGHQLRWYPHR